MNTLSLQHAAKLLQAGKVGVIPTDTVYGVACLASSNAAVDRLHHIKQRENKPGTIVAATIEQLEDLGLKRRYLKAVEQFWPAAVSVLIPCTDPALRYLHMDTGSIAVRIPADKKLRDLLSLTGSLLTSSANITSKSVAVTVDEAHEYFKNLVDFYVDGGDLSGRQPSTVIRIVDDAIEVIRQGAVDIKPNNERG